MKIVEVGNFSFSFHSYSDKSVNNLEFIKSEADLLEDVPMEKWSDNEGLEHLDESGHNISLNAIDEKTNFINIVNIGNEVY